MRTKKQGAQRQTVQAAGHTAADEAATSFLDGLQQRGHYSFTTEDLADAQPRSEVAIEAILRRWRQAGRIASPLRGFHVIVPPEYRRLGSLPAEQFVPDLMDHLGTPYYVTLLSAASYHGASHQAPQSFQVMLPDRRRAIRCGKVRVVFIVRRDMEATSIVERKTPRGALRVASAAATAVELVGYARHCGGLDNVATVIAELTGEIDAGQLRREVERAPAAWAQRLGFLAEQVGSNEVAEVVEEALASRETFWVALEPSLPVKGSPGSSRWRVTVNTEVEPDL